jgi:myo-inositol 2-dehydrogenase/D-chiro-inositol 1-dehydrogenase
MDKLRMGLVGYGRFGKIHAEAISATGAAEVTCACVGTEERALEVKKILGIDAVYTDYDEFLEKGKMDVVDIVSPNNLHAEQTIKAIERGMDIFLEKPMAVTVEDARKIIEAHRHKPTKIQVGFNYRYEPFWKEIKSDLQQGAVTRPTFAKIEDWRGPFRQGSGGWRFDGSRVGHQLLELAVHYFDIAAWYFGIPETISGFTDSPQTWKNGVFRSALGVLSYPSGLKVIVANTLNGFSTNVSVSVSGDGALFGEIQTAEDWVTTSAWVRVKDTAGAFRGVKLGIPEEAETMTMEMADFVETVRKGREPSVTLEDGFKALSLALTTIASVESGRPEKPPVL